MRRFRVHLPSWMGQLPSHPHHLRLARRIHASASSGAGQGRFLLPGASAAALLMLGVLHAKRMYDDRKLVEQKEKGIEPEFATDLKASFLRLLPLRSMSRFWGSLMEVEVPVFMRPAVYKGWARAFHSNLEESALPLEEYPSLQAFFIRSLKEGSRPIDADPNCLVSPVDGKVLRLGQLRGPGAMIEQVKGFSYPVSSLLGAGSSLHDTKEEEEVSGEQTEQNRPEVSNGKSWWRVSVASPKLRDQTRLSPKRGIFYCVLYLHPGDYHRVHSPADWNIFKRRHFPGNLFPTNERAVRTIRNLYVENERVVLEGRWKEGFVAIAAVGATNVGSIKLFMEPELTTNSPGSSIIQHSQPYNERVYEPEGTGVMVKKGEEIAGFNMGSTVVVVFEAPLSKAREDGTGSSEFDFCIKPGDRIRVGEAIGRWNE